VSVRPVIILGHGVRLAGAVHLVPALLDLGAPVLTSWPAADLVDSDHPNYYGRPGVYGQRCANKVFAQADLILAIGCRLSVWTVGYDFPQPSQRVVAVDIDGAEARSFGNGVELIQQDAKAFIEDLLARRNSDFEWDEHDLSRWRVACDTARARYPWLESPLHEDANGYINPHRFVSNLQAHLKPDEIIVTDCATGSLCAHQILKLKPPMRLMTSGGLGEMGCGLPAAIGAAFASGRRVICLHTDGAMMFNLSELQTIAHHHLPIKIIVFANDGYGMIRDTQRNLGYAYNGVDTDSGVSCPHLAHVAAGFGLRTKRLRGERYDHWIAGMLDVDGPALLEIVIDPEYRFGPKLRPIRREDGTILNARFDEMSPDWLT
jgi:acetolactate synthase-1/2/3 large subunit